MLNKIFLSNFDQPLWVMCVCRSAGKSLCFLLPRSTCPPPDRYLRWWGHYCCCYHRERLPAFVSASVHTSGRWSIRMGTNSVPGVRHFMAGSGQYAWVFISSKLSLLFYNDIEDQPLLKISMKETCVNFKKAFLVMNHRSFNENYRHILRIRANSEKPPPTWTPLRRSSRLQKNDAATLWDKEGERWAKQMAFEKRRTWRAPYIDPFVARQKRNGEKLSIGGDDGVCWLCSDSLDRVHLQEGRWSGLSNPSKASVFRHLAVMDALSRVFLSDFGATVALLQEVSPTVAGERRSVKSEKAICYLTTVFFAEMQFHLK